MSDDITAFLYKFHTRYYEDDTDDDSSGLTFRVFEFRGNLAIDRCNFDKFIVDELVAKHDADMCDVYWLQFGTGKNKLDICVYPGHEDTHSINQELPIKFVENEHKELINQIKLLSMINYIVVYEMELELRVSYHYWDLVPVSPIHDKTIITKEYVYILNDSAQALVQALLPTTQY